QSDMPRAKDSKVVSREKRAGLRRLGRLIRRARKERRLTQGQLAKRIGKSRYLVSKIENGKHQSVNHGTVRAIAQVLGLSHIRLIWDVQRSLLEKHPEHAKPIRILD